MNRYVIRENIPYEGWNQWTVFALNEELAKAFIRMDKRYTGESLQVHTRKPARGRKESGIHKYSSNFEL